MRGIMTVFALTMLTVGAVAADGSLPNRLDQVKAGEWLLLKDVSGARIGELTKFSVSEVKGEGADKVVVMTIDRYHDEKIEETRDIEIPVSRYAERMAGLEARAKQIGRERLTIKDREIVVVTVTWDDDREPREIKLWLSDELPIGGLAKSWSSDPDFPAAELVDYGF
ncbi:MAG: hypothetical protein FWG74_05505 [Planctomycetes bacterium]|nr:hypothetical protein [Planctomycetota bacterium]